MNSDFKEMLTCFNDNAVEYLIVGATRLLSTLNRVTPRI